MTQRLNDPSHLQARETTRDQLAAMKAARPGRLAYDTPDAADATYSFVPRRLLWSQQDDAEVRAVMSGPRGKDLDAIGTVALDATASPVTNVVVNRITPRRRRTQKAVDRRRTAVDLRRAGHGDPALEAMLAIFDDELGEGVVTPDHYLHLANGDGRHCPATEPEETGLAGPWPPQTTQSQAGAGVRVAVVDTGWHTLAGQVAATSYLASNV